MTKDDSSTVLNWDDANDRLARSTRGVQTDELVDDLAAAAIALPSPKAVPCLILSFSLADSDLTTKSAALALALCAEPNAREPVDVLTQAFRDSSDDAFLAPSVLDALFILACRNTLARTELSSLLQRIDKHRNPHLVAKAATICGRLLQLRFCPELKDKLTEFTDSPHELAAADARYHLACVNVSAVTAATDRNSLMEALRKSTDLFRSAEPRPDARAIRHLLELFLRFCDEREVTSAGDHMTATYAALGQWPGYESPELTLFLDGATRSIDALKIATNATNEADRWLDIQSALIELAKALTCLVHCNLGESHALLATDLSTIGDKNIGPEIGAVLLRAVGRKRVEAAVKRAEGSSDSEQERVMRDLLAIIELAEKDPALESEQIATSLQLLSETTGRDPSEIVSGLQNAMATGQIGPWIESVAPNHILPIHEGEFFGADPAVHFTVCRVLEELRSQLGSYELSWWNQLRSTVASVVQFVHIVRDDLPNYCLCEADNGMGQAASESELQADLFRWLRRGFGNQCVYEAGPVAGGRTDSGVRFPEAEFPIEVKHEFQHVERSHVRDNYIGQPSSYASVRQRVSFLLILDLRKMNAASHRENIKAAKSGNNAPTIAAMYTLNDGFWLESLPADPEIENGEDSVVVVGVVPGNRPKPSSQTKYSERPRKARKSAKKPNGK